MFPQGIHIVFDPPRWPVVLSAAAGAVLLWEAASLLGTVWRGRTAGRAIGMSVAALLAGPVVTVGLGFYGAMMMATGDKFRALQMLLATLRGSLVLMLAALTVYWPTGGSVIAIAACGVLWAIRGYGATTTPIKRRTKIILLVLRIASLLLLATWVLSPALEYHHEEEVRGVLLIGVDTSGSMGRYDMPPKYKTKELKAGTDPIRRIDAVRQAVQDQRSALEDLADRADIELFNFSATAEPPVGLLTEKGQPAFTVGEPNGLATALGDSTAGAFSPYINKGRKVVGVILITDGCNNTSDVVDPETEARLLGQRNVPIHTVGAGSERVTGSMRILTVKELAAPKPGQEEVQRFNSLPISATVDAFGLHGKQIKVTARFADEVVGEETYGVDGDQQSIPVRFVHVPLASGLHRVSVTAECTDPTPNLAGVRAASKLVRVVDNELRVLYVEGKFRFEAKYVAQALVAARRFTVDRRVLLQPLRAEEAPPFSEKLEDWLAYHAIIFGDVAPSRFSTKQLEIIKELVGKYGKGFCMIGGTQSFGRGGWAGTPIADVLPIDLGASRQQIEGEIKVNITREGETHDVMRIGGEGEAIGAAWAKLPALTGADRLEGVKPAGQVLAESPQRDPLIVAQRYGAGRSLAIAFDTTYRWVLNVEDTAELQRRFWRQVALYLSDPKGHVWINTDKTSYDLRRLTSGAETVEVSAGVEDFQGRPVMDVKVDATLTPPGGQPFLVKLEARETSRHARLPAPSDPGIYTLKISATVADKPMSAEHRFEVVQRDMESLDLLANHKLLKEMARISGGRYAPLAELPDMLKELSITTQPEKVPAVVHKGLAEKLHWPMVAAIIAFLCIEWAIRKRKGLV